MERGLRVDDEGWRVKGGGKRGQGRGWRVVEVGGWRICVGGRREGGWRVEDLCRREEGGRVECGGKPLMMSHALLQGFAVDPDYERAKCLPMLGSLKT